MPTWRKGAFWFTRAAEGFDSSVRQNIWYRRDLGDGRDLLWSNIQSIVEKISRGMMTKAASPRTRRDGTFVKYWSRRVRLRSIARWSKILQRALEWFVPRASCYTGMFNNADQVARVDIPLRLLPSASGLGNPLILQS